MLACGKLLCVLLWLRTGFQMVKIMGQHVVNVIMISCGILSLP